MPNIKSAKKRTLIIEKKTLENRMIKSRLNTAIRKFKETVNNDLTNADTLYNETVSVIDNAVTHGIIHKSNADRKKARLAIYLAKAKAAN